jgi:hypothetical protein
MVLLAWTPTFLGTAIFFLGRTIVLNRSKAAKLHRTIQRCGGIEVNKFYG